SRTDGLGADPALHRHRERPRPAARDDGLQPVRQRLPGAHPAAQTDASAARVADRARPAPVVRAPGADRLGLAGRQAGPLPLGDAAGGTLSQLAGRRQRPHPDFWPGAGMDGGARSARGLRQDISRTIRSKKESLNMEFAPEGPMAIPLWINGHAFLTAGNSFFEVTNPATGEAIRRVPLCGEGEAREAVTAARTAQPV